MNVVLMHGFGAFMHLLANRSIRPIVRSLGAAGYRVHAPVVQPYNTVADRAEMWMSHLAAIRDGEPGPMHLVGFSSGGLDARYIVSKLGGHEFVASLTTISTPHRGSTLASYVLESSEFVRNRITRFADWMGDRLHESQASDARRALEQLTPDYMTDVFNPDVQDHAHVVYRSWAGRAGKGTGVPILPVLRFGNRIIYEQEGPNDGLVSVKSAEWTGFQGTIDADHARQIGVRAMNGAFDATAFLSSILADLDN